VHEIKKAVIPLGGLGARMLPASKVVPKEMLTVVDKPIIHYIIEEAAAAGIEHIIFVTRVGKGALEDYFDSHFELEETLSAKGANSKKQLDSVKFNLPNGVTISSIRQQFPKGLGHAVLCAEPIVRFEPFAVMLPDVLLRNGLNSNISDMARMTDDYRKNGNPLIMAEEVPDELVHQYGIIGSEQNAIQAGEFFKMSSVVEKPEKDEAPSNLAIVGRYVLPPSILPILANQSPGKGNEIQLTDAILSLMSVIPFSGYRMSGSSFDCGSKIGLMKANICYGLEHPEIGAELREYLSEGILD
jgi:UTP--glucose-1-phosphate uridylyltransferase